MPMHALWNHWSHVSQHTPGVVKRTAFLHMLHGNLGGPGWVATSQALLTSIADRLQRQSVVYKVHNKLTHYSLPIYCVPPARALKGHHKYSY